MMGTRSKGKKIIKPMSLRPIKQWCKARGLDWKAHLGKFPHIRIYA
jgi:hypothetical protein